MITSTANFTLNIGDTIVRNANDAKVSEHKLTTTATINVNSSDHAILKSLKHRARKCGFKFSMDIAFRNFIRPLLNELESEITNLERKKYPGSSKLNYLLSIYRRHEIIDNYNEAKHSMCNYKFLEKQAIGEMKIAAMGLLVKSLDIDSFLNELTNSNCGTKDLVIRIGASQLFAKTFIDILEYHKKVVTDQQTGAYVRYQPRKRTRNTD